MADSERHEGPAPIAVIQYELTDEIAIQSALDLLEHRAPKNRRAGSRVVRFWHRLALAAWARCVARTTQASTAP
jgi:hypothetical protein